MGSVIIIRQIGLRSVSAPNTAGTRSPARYAGTGVVGRFAVRVFKQFAQLGVGSDRVALSRPTHQYLAELPPVGTACGA